MRWRDELVLQSLVVLLVLRLPGDWWGAELIAQFILILLISRLPDDRKRFEGWLVARFAFDCIQLVSERSGHNQIAVNVWYCGVVLGSVLLLLALLEAAQLPNIWHRRILFSWTALSMGAAWIRFFPYTGKAVLFIDAAAFICWSAELLLRGQSKPAPRESV